MKMFVLLSFIYDHHEFERFEQVSLKKETLEDYTKSNLDKSPHYYKEVTDCPLRHEELVDENTPHYYIEEIETI